MAVRKPLVRRSGRHQQIPAGDTLPPAVFGANLEGFAGLTGAADRLPYFTGIGALSLAPLTAKARELIAAATEADMRTVIGLGDSGWITPTLVSGWVAFGGAFQPPQYKKVGNRVWIRGMVSNPSAVAGTIFTLPAGYRPPATSAFGMFYGNLTQTYNSINSSGVYATSTGAASTALPLDCTFEVAP